MAIFCNECGLLIEDITILYCKRCEEHSNSAYLNGLVCPFPISFQNPVHGSFLSTFGKRTLILGERYEIQEEIKSGNMGCLYKARDITSNIPVAIKKIIPSLTDLAEQQYTIRRFREEVEILLLLNHEGIPQLIDFFSEPDPVTNQPAHFLVMSFVNGRDLEIIMKGRANIPLPLDEVLDYFGQLLDILQFLHSQEPPVIHRDISLKNIMIDDNRVYLVDFGIARVFKSVKRGTAIGTPGYAPPEQYKGFADQRSDIFGLGAAMHYLLTGRNPEDNYYQPFVFPSPHSIDPSIPPHLSDLIMSMLDVIPRNRPQSAEAIKTALHQPCVPMLIMQSMFGAISCLSARVAGGIGSVATLVRSAISCTAMNHYVRLSIGYFRWALKVSAIVSFIALCFLAAFLWVSSHISVPFG